MRFPALDQYNEAVQHPRTAFSDPALKSGDVRKNSFGIPVALGGGFAITYTVKSGANKYAVRCFHRQADGIEGRYKQISQALRQSSLPYFVGFEYQPTGLAVNGERYPIVKMDWVEGETLGGYLEREHSKTQSLKQLLEGFRQLEAALRKVAMAHGDIQNGNVIVGPTIKLVDYDGIFVPGMAVGKGTELGHKHFQHPRRDPKNFGSDMDRFSFIAVDLSLRALIERPALFTKFSSGENILFSASDYNDPARSPLFSELRALSSLAKDTEHFARVCLAECGQVPSLEDFLAGRNIPATVIQFVRPQEYTKAEAPKYVGAFDVISGADFAAVLARVGDRIEMVAQIIEVRSARTRHGKRYVFVNFGPWKGKVAKINIWSEGLAKLSQQPTDAWVGRWVSVTGLVDSPYTNHKYGYTHVSITIEDSSQLRLIDAAEAKRRLGSVGVTSGATAGSNAAVLQQLGRGKARLTGTTARATSNQQILQGIKTGTGASSPARSGAPQQPSGGSSGEVPAWVWWVGIFVLMGVLRTCG